MNTEFALTCNNAIKESKQTRIKYTYY